MPLLRLILIMMHSIIFAEPCQEIGAQLFRLVLKNNDLSIQRQELIDEFQGWVSVDLENQVDRVSDNAPRVNAVKVFMARKRLDADLDDLSRQISSLQNLYCGRCPKPEDFRGGTRHAYCVSCPTQRECAN